MREGPRYDWIIAVSNSADGSGIKMLKTYCKVSEVKQILVDLAERDARKDVAAFKHGTDNVSQLQVVKHDAPFAVDIGFAACNVFDAYRIDYTAHELEHENYSEPEDVLKHIEPDYTSQCCPVCSYTDKANRNSKSFKCQCCGYEADADYVGALNIKARAEDTEIFDVCEKYKYNHDEMQKHIKMVYHARNEKYKAAAGKAVQQSEGSGSRDAA